MKLKLTAFLLILAFAITSLADVGGVNGQNLRDRTFDSIFIAGETTADEKIGSLATVDGSGNPDANIIVLRYSEAVRVYNYSKAAITASMAVTTPSAKTFTCAVTDICTATAHGFSTGLKGQASTTGTLPTGLAISTDYFVITLDADTFKLATSYANAIAGTAIDITGTGTGTHTFTPTALAGGAVSLQGSIDGTTWADIASTSQNVTAATVLIFSITDTYYPLARLKYVNTAGVLTANTKYAAKF